MLQSSKERVEQAYQMMLKHNFKQAEMTCQSLIDHLGEEESNFKGLGSLEDHNGFYSNQIEYYIRQQILCNSTTLCAYDCLSLCYAFSQKYELGERWYKQALKKRQDYRLHYGLATIYYNSDQHRSALEHYKKAIHLRPNLDCSYHQIAFIEYYHKREHNEDEAIKYVKQALHYNPHNMYAQMLRVLIQQVGLQQIPKLEVLSLKYPKYLRIPNNIGKVYMEQGNYELALRYLSYCITKEPKYATPYFNLAMMSVKKGKFQEAVSHLQNCLNKNQRMLECQLYIGRLLYTYLDRQEEAYYHLRNALKQQKTESRACLQLGRLENKRHNYDKAIQWFKKSHQIDGTSHQPLMALGVAFQNLRQYEQAIRWHLKCLQVNPSNSTSIVGIADSYYELGEMEKSLSFYQDCHQNTPEHALSYKSYLNFVSMLVEKQQFSLAIEILRQSLQVHPRKITLQVYIAQIYRQIKEYDSMGDHFKKAEAIMQSLGSEVDEDEEEALLVLLEYQGKGEYWIRRNERGYSCLKNRIILSNIERGFKEVFTKLYKTNQGILKDQS